MRSWRMTRVGLEVGIAGEGVAPESHTEEHHFGYRLECLQDWLQTDLS